MTHTPTDATRKQVDVMAGCGVPEDAIARAIDISPMTLRKHYRHELDTGHIRANCAVAQSLFKKATGTGPQSVTAAIFWLKCRAAWKDTAMPEGKKEFEARRAEAIANGSVKSKWSDLLVPPVDFDN